MEICGYCTFEGAHPPFIPIPWGIFYVTTPIVSSPLANKILYKVLFGVALILYFVLLSFFHAFCVSHLQEVWYVVLESLHRMLLPMLQWDKEGVQAVNSDFPAHHYTSRQCTALETMLEILRVMAHTLISCSPFVCACVYKVAHV